MSRGNKWVKIDRYLAQEFRYIRREFSEIEAMFSYTIDVDKGIKGSISGYSNLWNWSRNRVRKFIKNILSQTGHYRDRKQTESRQAIHFIDSALETKPDRNRTETGQKPDTTIKTKTKTKTKESIYTSNFLSFWNSYPKKIGKGKAFQNYKNIKDPKPSLQIVLDAIKIQNKSDQWQDKQFIPHPATWLSQRRWEDEIEPDPINGTPKRTNAEILS